MQDDEASPQGGPPEGPGEASDGPAPSDHDVEPVFDDLGQPLPARAFDPSIAAELGEFGSLRPLRTVCMWCNGPLESRDLDVCPHCGAALKPVSDDIDIPGVTVAPVDLKKARAAAAEAVARALARPGEAVAAPGVRPDLEPPSDAVRRAMREFEGGTPSQASAERMPAVAAEPATADGERPPEEAGGQPHEP